MLFVPPLLGLDCGFECIAYCLAMDRARRDGFRGEVVAIYRVASVLTLVPVSLRLGFRDGLAPPTDDLSDFDRGFEHLIDATSFSIGCIAIFGAKAVLGKGVEVSIPILNAESVESAAKYLEQASSSRSALAISSAVTSSIRSLSHGFNPSYRMFLPGALLAKEASFVTESLSECLPSAESAEGSYVVINVSPIALSEALRLRDFVESISEAIPRLKVLASAVAKAYRLTPRGSTRTSSALRFLAKYVLTIAEKSLKALEGIQRDLLVPLARRKPLNILIPFAITKVVRGGKERIYAIPPVRIRRNSVELLATELARYVEELAKSKAIPLNPRIDALKDLVERGEGMEEKCSRICSIVSS